MPHPLLELLLITEQDARKSGLTEAEIVKKIFTDNLVTLRAQELMVHAYATQVVAAMGPLERERLRKHALPVQKPKTNWVVELTPTGGMLWLKAVAPDGEWLPFAGYPKDAPKFQFHGEHPPQSALDEYTRRYESLRYRDGFGRAYDHNPL